MTTAIILAGGRGTRSANPEVAKVCVQIDGKALLQYHFDLLASSRVTDVVVVAGFASDQVSQVLEKTQIYGAKPRLLVEQLPNGVMGALRWAVSCSSFPLAERLLILLGDVLMSFRVDDFLARWENSQKPVGVVVHPSTHPDDSDAVFEGYDGVVLASPKGRSSLEVPNMSSAGVFAIRVRDLELFADGKDFGSDVLPKAASTNQLFVYRSSHYLRDTGTASRLSSVQVDVSSGVFARRGSLHPRPAIFLDRDGVVNPVLPESPSPDEYRVCDGVVEAIGRVNQKGVPIFVVTNQPGIAKGFFSEQYHQIVRARMDAILGRAGCFVDDYSYCPHHPEKGFENEVPELKIQCLCRKPETGMVDGLVSWHHLDVRRSVVVGDTWRDCELAQRIGSGFIHVAMHRTLPGPHETFNDPADAILRALDIVS